MRKSKGNVLAVLLVIILTLGCVGVFFALFKDNIADEKANERIVEVTEDNGKLSVAQVKSLENGADIQYNGEIYRLSQTGEENVYAHNDEENIFVRKYIAVNTSDGFYRSWNKVNDEYVTKALLNSALSDYATGSDVDSALSNALAGYLNNEDVKKTISAALVNYVKSVDLGATLADYTTNEVLKNELANALSIYVTKSQLNNRLNYRFDNAIFEKCLSPGESLTFKKNAMYVVYCMDEHDNLTNFKITGGDKDGATGIVAFAFIGNDMSCSTTFYQTGKIVLNNLVATAGGATGISVSEQHHLFYYQILGRND